MRALLHELWRCARAPRVPLTMAWLDFTDGVRRRLGREVADD